MRELGVIETFSLFLDALKHSEDIKQSFNILDKIMGNAYFERECCLNIYFYVSWLSSCASVLSQFFLWEN